MSEGYAIKGNTIFAYKEETTENTAATDAAGDFVRVRTEGLSWNIDREMINPDDLTGTLSQSAPYVGMYGEVGFNVSVRLRNSGTLGTLPDWFYLMKHTMGGVHEGTSGTVEASPTPTTTGFTLASDTGTVGGLISVPVSTWHETVRVTALASHAYSVWPPLTAAPSPAATVHIGDTLLLKSASSDFYSGSGFFYNAGGTKKLYFTGCKGKSAKISIAVGQPAMVDFVMQALAPITTYAAIGYTPTRQTSLPVVCMGLDFYTTYAGTQGASSAVGAVHFASTYGTEVAIGDEIIIDTTGAGAYETKTITSVTNSGTTDVTLGHGNFSAVYSTGAAYIRRKAMQPIKKLEISIENTLYVDEGIQATYGKIRQFVTKRDVKVNLPERIAQSFYDVTARDNLISREIYGTIGSTSGNMVALYIPKFYGVGVTLDPGEMIMAPLTGHAAMTSGNDELYVSLL